MYIFIKIYQKIERHDKTNKQTYIGSSYNIFYIEQNEEGGIKHDIFKDNY